jgi:asparagine synthase (glutamine-hydrolysing)
MQFGSEGDHYLALNSLIPTAVKPRLFQPWAWKLAEDDHSMRSHYDRMFGDRDGENPHRKQAAVIHQVNLEALLSRLDRSTMAAGLEARVPFADHVLVDKMFRLPMRYKIDVAHHELAPHLSSAALQQRGSLRSKRLLRTVAQRRLPTELASRKKASFPTPVASWFEGPWQPWVQQTLMTSPFARNLFQAEPLAELASNPAAAGMWLWPIVNLAVWGDQEFAAA